MNFISFLIAGLITLASYFVISIPSAIALPINALPINSMAAIPIVSNLFKGTTPENLGVDDGKLNPCPTTPNCVVSEEADTTHAIDPITYHVDRDTAQKVLLQVLSVVPRTTVMETTDGYIRVESTSRLLGFVDDAEFYFPTDKKLIEVRSASRVGESDLGVNRRRIEQIRLAMEDLGV